MTPPQSHHRDATHINTMDQEEYDISSLPPHIISTLFDSIDNTSTASSRDDLDIFFHCWIKPHCPACLSPDNKYPCSWCATSQTCVPNTVYDYPFGILAPLKTDSLCPLGWRERWELRARPFSCRCSSMTFVSVVVAVVATFLSLQLIWLLITICRWAGRRWRRRQKGWWRSRNWVPTWMQRTHRDPAAPQSQENDSEGDGDGITSQPPRQNDETTPLLA